MHNYYNILGITKSASQAQIKKAYRKLALKWHPDKNKSPGAEARFIKITEAYKILSDPEARKSYDRGSRYKSTSKASHQSTTSKSAYEKWSDLMAARAKREAFREAHMDYKDFKKENFSSEWDEQLISACAALGIIFTVISLYYSAYINSLYTQLDGPALAYNRQDVLIELKEAKSMRQRQVIAAALAGLAFLFLWLREKKKKSDSK